MRPGSFETEAVRIGFNTGVHALVSVTEALAERETDWEASLSQMWPLRTVLGHCGRALTTPVKYLEEGRGLEAGETHPFDYFNALCTDYFAPTAIEERARIAGAEMGDHPETVMAALAETALQTIAAASDEDPVQTPAGLMTLGSYLPSRVFELTTHTAEIAAAAELPFEPSEEAAMICLMMSVGAATEASDCLPALRALTGQRPG